MLLRRRGLPPRAARACSSRVRRRSGTGRAVTGSSRLAQEGDLGSCDRRGVPHLPPARRRDLRDEPQLERHRADSTRRPADPQRPGLRLAGRRRCGDSPCAPLRDSHDADAHPYPRLGERRPRLELGADPSGGPRRLRRGGGAPLSGRPALDGLGRADAPAELHAARSRDARGAAHPRGEARAAPLRAHARCFLRRSQGRAPAQPRDRWQQLHDGRHLAAELDQGHAPPERQAPADGHVRAQPLHAAPARPAASRSSARRPATRTSPTSTRSGAGSTDMAIATAVAGSCGSSSPSGRCPPITSTTSSTSG